jgi:hypothetical protein
MLSGTTYLCVYLTLSHHNGYGAIDQDDSVCPAHRTYDQERYLRDEKLRPSVKDPGEGLFSQVESKNLISIVYRRAFDPH